MHQLAQFTWKENIFKKIVQNMSQSYVNFVKTYKLAAIFLKKLLEVAQSF